MKTEFVNPQKIKRHWYVIDAQNRVLGKIATAAAHILRGKNKAIYNPGHDTGDFVIVINSKDLVLTGNKWDDKMYHHHSGYVGGLKSRTASEVHQRDATELVKMAIQGMLPKGPLGRKMLKKLKVYAHAEHGHEAQEPQPFALA